MTTEAERYVVDTHAIVWYLTDDSRLTERAGDIIRVGETGQHQLLVPMIVLAELLRIVEKGTTSLSLASVVDWMGRSPGIAVVPFDIAIFVHLIDTERSLELHDRIVAATAREAKARLISRDRELGGVVETIW